MAQVHWVSEAADVEVTHEQEGDRNMPRQSVMSFRQSSRDALAVLFIKRRERRGLCVSRLRHEGARSGKQRNGARPRWTSRKMVQLSGQHVLGRNELPTMSGIKWNKGLKVAVNLFLERRTTQPISLPCLVARATPSKPCRAGWARVDGRRDITRCRSFTVWEIHVASHWTVHYDIV